MDPLRCLREFCSGNKLNQIRSIPDQRNISFGDDYEFSQDIKTRFLSSVESKPYKLDALLFFVRFRTEHGTGSTKMYMQQTKEAHVDRVSRPDQENAWQYLTGLTDTVSNVQAASQGAPLKRKLEDEPGAVNESGQKQYRVRDHERQLRVRDNLMVVPNKNFETAVELYNTAEKAVQKDIHQSREVQERLKRDQAAKAPSKANPQDASQRPQAASKPQSRMDRAPAVASKQHESLGIDILGPSAPAPATAPYPEPPPPPRPSSSGSARPRSSSSQQPPHPSSSRQHPSHGSSRSVGDGRAKAGAVARPASDIRLAPIIVVPSGTMAMVNSSNALSLLQNGKFVEPDASKIKDTAVQISRPSANDPRRTIQYEVTSKAPSPGSKDWQRVVAVVCQGAKWQFKGWPFETAAQGETVELFSSIRGFYFHWQDTNVPETIKSWNVKKLPLARNSRHNDVQAVQEMFENITKFLDARKQQGPHKKGCLPEKLRYK